MAEKNRNNHSRPGIPDALHPEIGNGSLWENQTHAFLLRSPDPSKELEALLNDPNTKANVLEAWTHDHNLNGEDTINRPGPADERLQPISEETSEQIKDDLKDINQDIESSTRSLPHQEDKESVASSEESKSLDDPSPPVESFQEPEIQKTPKAGKRVKKAVKAVSKQEAKAKKAIEAETPPTESGSSLSPFTKWLKGLSGSDYVHPYDDDFAFTQSSGPGKEGISETFAELLASQGYKERAVEMYLKLMEKYPEKSGFFAAKIEALQ